MTETMSDEESRFTDGLFTSLTSTYSMDSDSTFLPNTSQTQDARAPSPSVQSVSSIASTQRLEWDSGADIGYGDLKSMFGLSTLERMAIGSYCSAFKQMKPNDERVLFQSGSNDPVQGETDGHRRMHDVSQIESLEETEDQITEYQRHLELKEFEEHSVWPSKKTYRSTECEGAEHNANINTRVMALKIVDKRSSSMTDISDLDDQKKCYLNKFKRIHSCSTPDVSPVKKTEITSRSTSPSCSAFSSNSSNTVVGVASHFLRSNSEKDSKKNVSICHDLENSSVVLKPKMSRGVINSETLQEQSSSDKTSYQNAVPCNTKVMHFARNFVNTLCSNSGDARRQRLLRKILEDFDILLRTENEENRLIGCQDNDEGDSKLRNDLSSQQLSFKRNLFDAVSEARLKPCNFLNGNVLLCPYADKGGYSCAAFHIQQCFRSDSRDSEVPSLGTESSCLSSSEDSCNANLHQLKNAEIPADRSSVNSPEPSKEKVVYPFWIVEHSENHDQFKERRTNLNTQGLCNELNHMVTAQRRKLQGVKKLVNQHCRRNIQRLQKDMLWLKHVEALLNTDQINQARAASTNYKLEDAPVQCELVNGRNSPGSLLTKDSRISSRCASHSVYLPSILKPDLSTVCSSPAKHFPSTGVQTSRRPAHNETFTFQEDALDPNFLENRGESTSLTMQQNGVRSQDDDQTGASELTCKALEDHLPTSAWFVPLIDDHVGMSRANSNQSRTDCKNGGVFRGRVALFEGRKSKPVLQELKPERPNQITSEQDKKCGKIGQMKQSGREDTNVGLKEIQGGFRKYTVPVSFSSQHHNPKCRSLSYDDMHQQTEKVYNILPEVTAQNLLKHRIDAYKTNRMMAQVYAKNLQKKVLSGHGSSLSSDTYKC